MNLLVKILIWIAIGVLVWLGVPLLLETVFGLVGIVFGIVKLLLSFALVALIALAVLYLWRRVRRS
jgi:hypothetical protein